MRWIACLLALALSASPAWAKSKELAQAIDLYESGQLSEARAQLRLLVDKRHFSERDRIQARLYLAATELSLQDPEGAREQLKILAQEHPRVRPDPAVFSPELVLLSDQLRQEVAQERSSTSKSARKSEAQRKSEGQRELEAQQKVDPQKQLAAQRAAEQQRQLEAQHKAAPLAQASPPNPSSASSVPHLSPDSSSTVASVGTEQRLPPVHSSRRTWGYAALGVGAAAAVVGAVFGLAARSAANDAAAARSPSDWQAAKDRVDSNGSKATVGFIAAGLAATGGMVLVATSF